jgi:hypothetical protein
MPAGIDTFICGFIESFPGDISNSRSPYGRIGPDGSSFTVWIHKALVLASSQSGPTARMFAMSISIISSITASAPVKPPDAVASPAPDANTHDDAADAAATQPTVAPLPPGQGTRIDQLV